MNKSKIAKQYEWVKKLVRKEFKTGIMVIAVGEFGHEVSLAYQNKIGDRHGVFLRSDMRLFDVNDLSQEEKNDFIKTIIRRFKESSLTIDDFEKNPISEALN